MAVDEMKYVLQYAGEKIELTEHEAAWLKTRDGTSKTIDLPRED